MSPREHRNKTGERLHRFSFGRRKPVEAFSGFQKAFSVFLLAEEYLWRRFPVFKRHSPFFFWQKTTCGGILQFSKGILRFSFGRRQPVEAFSGFQKAFSGFLLPKDKWKTHPLRFPLRR